MERCKSSNPTLRVGKNRTSCGFSFRRAAWHARALRPLHHEHPERCQATGEVSVIEQLPAAASLGGLGLDGVPLPLLLHLPVQCADRCTIAKDAPQLDACLALF